MDEENAIEILKQRAEQWGDPLETHARIAKAWSAIFNHDVTSHQVALAMIATKTVRCAFSPGEWDNYPDMKNYAEIAEMHYFPEKTNYPLIQQLLAEKENV